MARPQRGGSGPALPVTAYAVLGLLCFGPEVRGGAEVTGYDLRKWSKNMRYFYWSPAQSQIYAELRRLREHGLVDERVEPQQGRPDKRLYKITKAGLKTFRNWLNHAEVGPPALKHSVALRLFFGNHTDPDRLRQVLRDYADWAQQQIDELTELHPQLRQQHLAYPALVAAWGQAYFAAELAAVNAALNGLDEV